MFKLQDIECKNRTMICPICRQKQNALIQDFGDTSSAFIANNLKIENADWHATDGACTRCVDQAQIEQLDRYKAANTISVNTMPGDYQILSIPERLNSHPSYTGHGVTICMIDSGFYPHPDLCQPENRVLKVFDIHHPDKEIDWSVPHPQSWHGTMTSVVCAGNGYLSGGHYCSLAPDTKLVLIKVMDEKGAITGEAITKALDWVNENHQQYGIRIVNLSVSDDFATSYKESAVDRAIEKLVLSGINVVTAAGNTQGDTLKAPANSPHAITVGGLDDHDSLHPLTHSLYHSTYGETADRTFKPELIAPAIWIPAPILPNSAEQKEAAALWKIHSATQEHKKAIAANLLPHTQLPQSLILQPLAVLEKTVQDRIEATKYISANYQHSDGTSFAAPIVCSIIAQMLEANPKLSPSDVRDILLRTARPLPNLPEERQGFGVVHPLSAVYHAEEVHHYFPILFNPIIDYQKREVRFQFHQEGTAEAAMAGDFSQWALPGITLQTNNDKTDLLEVILPLPTNGDYGYKFLINHEHWQADTRNLYRVPDGYGGFNSLLMVE